MRTEGKAMVQSALHAGRKVPASRKTGTRRVLQRLLAGASTGAAALVINAIPLSAPAWAQAVNGTPTVVFGANAPVRTTGSDTITVNAHDALIDWTATDAGGVFLPTGNTLNFNADTSVSGAYTVLNRVTSSAAGASALQINGAVNSTDAGRIWFYNPTGWVVGSSGAFNVGSLLLTASPVTFDAGNPDGQKFTGTSGAIVLGQALNAGASITVQNGAQITTVAPGSYVALVAPRVVQGGTVSVNGSAAYVGAEAATLTVNNGLFDISVDTGTTDANGVVHTGTTTGAAATGSDPYHGIYLVAVPKNDVTTMLVSGSLGYTPAVIANGERDGAITLSAGYNVSDGNVNFPATPAAPGGRISVSGLTASNQVIATASDRIDVDATASSTNFQSAAVLNAQNAVALSAAAGNQIHTGGTLDIHATTGTVGGTATITATGGGALLVGGDLNVDVSGRGGIEFDPQNPTQYQAGSAGKDASGGTITATITDGQLAVNGQAQFLANAYGGAGELGFGRSDAGTISFTQSGANSSVRIGAQGDQSLLLRAQGTPESPYYSGVYVTPVTGAGSSAGNVSLSVADGSFAAGDTSLDSNASSAYGTDSVLYDASAGRVSASFTNGNFGIGGLSLSNSAWSSNTAAVGDVSLTLDAAQLTTRGTYYGISLYSTTSGAAETIDPQTGALRGPNTLRLALANGSTLNAQQGISLYTENSSPVAAASRSGDIVVDVSSASTIDSSSLTANTYASGYYEAPDAVSGNIAITAIGGSAITLTGALSAATDARGGNGTNGGGNGTAGDVTLRVEDSSLSVDALFLASSGYAGSNYNGGELAGLGTGGHVSFVLDGFNASLTAGSVQLDSLGSAVGYSDFAAAFAGPISAFDAPSSTNPHAGDGVGGTSEFTINGGTMTVGTLNVSADGFGGQASSYGLTTPVDGGAGTGGTASLTINGGTSSIASVTVEANGYGGQGSYQDSYAGIDAGNGGAGLGGETSLTLNGGVLSSNSVTLRAEGNTDYFDGYSYQNYGQGGTVDTAPGRGGTGGAGTGGRVSLTVNGGDLIDLPDDPSGYQTNLTVTLSAVGQGGQGGDIYQYGSGGSSSNADLFTGDGGAAQGGTVELTIGAGRFDATTTLLDSSAHGGLPGDFSSYYYYGSGGSGGYGGAFGGGGRGGDATGGTATLTIESDFTSRTLDGKLQTFSVNADGIGQSGLSGTSGGDGGDGQGGSATIDIIGGNVTLFSPYLSAEGDGGNGGASSLGFAGGNGGMGTGGAVALNVSGDQTGVIVNNVNINADGYGGQGAQGGGQVDQAGAGGNGGAGSGGSAVLTVTGPSSLTLTSGEGTYGFSADGFGGRGGQGGNAGFSGGTVVANGGSGGDANGGLLDIIVSNGGLIDLGRSYIEANAYGGAGGYAAADVFSQQSGTSLGGNGGQANGGAISFNVRDEGSKLSGTDFTAEVTAYGGDAAGSLGTDATTSEGARGGNGGDAIGGSITLYATRGGQVSLGEEYTATFLADAISGYGGSGSDAKDGTGARGGDGGDGGVATGGSVYVTSDIGSRIELGVDGSVAFTANGFASGGGNGGNGASNSAVGGAGGNGGNGGVDRQGVGGQIYVSLYGGNLLLGEASFNAIGTTQFNSQDGAGGAGGPAGGTLLNPIPAGASGNPGGGFGVFSSGGTVRLFVGPDEGDGISSFEAGNTTVNVTGRFVYPGSDGGSPVYAGQGASGSAYIENRGGENAATMEFQSLFVDASGYYGSYPSISVLTDGGGINVAGALTLLAAGPVNLQALSGGVIDIGDRLNVNAGAGLDITGGEGGYIHASSASLTDVNGLTSIYSVDCADQSCAVLRTDGNITHNGYGFYLSDTATVQAGGNIDIYATSFIDGGAHSGYFADGDILLRSIGTITLRNASGLTVTANAATPYGNPNPADLVLGEDEGGGVISASQGIDLKAGRDIIMRAGNRLEAGSSIALESGGDIIINSDNALVGNLSDPDEPGEIRLSAGTNTHAESSDIASLIVGAGSTVDARGGDIFLAGQAIDTRGASFFGSSFTADVLNGLSLGATQSDDGGQLLAGCLEGDICLGSVTVDNDIAVGLGDAAPLHVQGLGSLSGRNLSVTSIDTLSFDGQGGQTVTMRGAIDLRSVSGGIVLANGADVTGTSVDLSGATELSGNGIVRATAGNIGLGFGGDITVGSLIASGTLAGYHAEPATRFVTPGAFTVLDTLSIAGDVALTATGPIAIGSAVLSGSDLDLLSDGSVRLGATSGVRNITLSGATLDLGTISGTGAVDLTATGGITGSSISAGTTLVGTANDLNVSSLSAGGNLTLTVVNIAQIGSATAGGNILIDPISLTFGTMQATGSITLIGGDISGGILDAGTTLDVTAQGLISVGQRAVGQTITFRSADLDLGSQATLGTAARTTAITLINNGQSGMLLGDGLTGQTGYRLSNAEFGNIHSGGDLTINAGPSLQVGTLTGTAGSTVAANGVSTDGQIGATGTLRLITAGTASFGGAVTMSGMAGNTLAIDASGGTFIDAATGSIRLLEGQGRGGTLSVSGASLVATTSMAFTAIAGLTDLGAISARLDANDGVTAGRTVIEAGTLDVGVGQRFLVQNTATGTAYDDRRGLVVDTLTIRAGGAQAPTQIAINGIVGGQTGLAAISRISVNGAFATGSTVNGCLLADPGSCASESTPELVDDGDVRNVIVTYLDPPPGTNTVPTADSFTQSPLVQINEITPPGFAPLIDEPVTGTGNDDLLGEGQCREEGGSCAQP